MSGFPGTGTLTAQSARLERDVSSTPGANCGCGDDSDFSGYGDRAAGQLRALPTMPLAPTAYSIQANGANGIMRPYRPAVRAANAGALAAPGTAAPLGNSRPAEGEPFRSHVCADRAI